ncbi:MAG: hypothetical protein NVSMB32_08570 [Actinomycetota bacterium]
MGSRYAQWDGSQDPFGPELDVGQILDELSDDILSGEGAQAAIRRLLRRGMPGQLNGLNDLRRRLEAQRRTTVRQLNLEGTLFDLALSLAEILTTERQELAGRPGEDARMQESLLDSLPASPASALKELMDYRFASQEAQERFQELLARVQREILDAHFASLSGGMGSMTPGDVARVREMMAALNTMIAARDQGEDYDFPAFMASYGDFFPEHPKTLQALLEVLARRLQPNYLNDHAPLERVYGTNMQHAFMLARRLLAEDPRAAKQVIMVTDGEPTAHLMNVGPQRAPEAFFSWPPTSETIHQTLAEAMHLAASGVTLNVFMLEDSPGLVSFMEKLGSLTGGRVFRMDNQELGRFILSDYVRRRS